MVPAAYFASELLKARTFHDVYRIFYYENLTDSSIESLLTSHTAGQYYGPRGPIGRIGGVHMMHPTYHRPTMQGTSPNGMPQHKVCEKCVIIPKASVPSIVRKANARRHEHQKRRKRRDRKKEKEKRRKKGGRKRKQGKQRKKNRGKIDVPRSLIDR